MGRLELSGSGFGLDELLYSLFFLVGAEVVCEYFFEEGVYVSG